MLVLAVYVTTFLVGFPANVFALATLLSKARRGLSPAEILLLNLTAADLLLLLFLPFKMAEAAAGMTWPLPAALCPLANFCFFSSIYLSSLFLAALSVERYLGVAFPLWHKLRRRPRLYLAVSAGLWLLACSHCSVVFFAAFRPTNSSAGDGGDGFGPRAANPEVLVVNGTEVANPEVLVVNRTEVANPEVLAVNGVEMANPEVLVVNGAKTSNPKVLVVNGAEMSNPEVLTVNGAKMANPKVLTVNGAKTANPEVLAVNRAKTPNPEVLAVNKLSNPQDAIANRDRLSSSGGFTANGSTTPNLGLDGPGASVLQATAPPSVPGGAQGFPAGRDAPTCGGSQTSFRCYDDFSKAQLRFVLPLRLELFLVLFLLPFAVTVFCYVNFVRALLARPNIPLRKKQRAVGLAVATMVNFGLCFAPYNLSHVVGFAQQRSPGWRPYALVLTSLNAALDPLVFYCSSAAVQRAVAAVAVAARGRARALASRCCRLRPAEAAAEETDGSST
ncbi:free fatty acid receptor 3-like [Dromaius novaehollandiae]|uniref:free fatty acid receptor 3-like n=1 Tax=Dromaius novaehollandiae TaxID=8790 RepID=UPI00311F60B4